MHATSTAKPTAHSGAASRSSIAQLQQAIEHAAHLLPAQGPITVFIHHNTLHAFEEESFDDGVKHAAKVFGCQPYLSEQRYRQELAGERIHPDDLRAELRERLIERADEPILSFGSRLDLRLSMLEHAIHQAPAAELRWLVAETDALKQFRSDVGESARGRSIEATRRWVLSDAVGVTIERERRAPQNRHVQGLLQGLVERFGQPSADWSDSAWERFTLHALWRICKEGAHTVPLQHPAGPTSHRLRDLILSVTGEDSDELVHEVLIRFCGALLDQGFAPWPLPNRDAGFLKAFIELYGSGRPAARWLNGLRKELASPALSAGKPLESIYDSLEQLGVRSENYDEFITSSLLALRGWAGMIRQMEIRADRAAHPVPPGTLVEFLAVRLILERLAITYIARASLGFDGSLQELEHYLRIKLPKHSVATVEQRAFTLFQLAQIHAWPVDELLALTRPQWTELVGEVEAFSALERRSVFHGAYERHYRMRTLDALSLHEPYVEPTAATRFQVVTCLDEREESFRRHLEELAPDVRTHGAAGFFNVAMYYRGAADANYVPLCPIVVQPQHWVAEDVALTLEETHRRRSKRRWALGTAMHHLHLGSRTFAGGAVLAAGVGVLASIPLVGRVVFPRLTAKIRSIAGSLVRPPVLTRLQLERSLPIAGPDDEQIGFTVHEMAAIAERLLRDIGLTHGFAKFVILFGHGSNSLNNPHNSAYNCGACGGRAGGPNARAVAQMFNDVRVRDLLVQRGISIPSDTIFVGAYHNTCDDSVTYYDLDRIPKSHRAAITDVREIVERACDRNAHERCRRFESAPLSMSFSAARRHVQGRSEDLAQTRPECGHASNAVCIVGRRSRTRGLFMDRRAFLTCYDPEQDDAERTILTRILQAAVPVCAGINLEYYFSYVDSTGWGSGTKLPHNVASLLGVMDGAASDLRTGLPWQMVEIHEPMRLLLVIETTPEAMLMIMDRNPGIARLCRNNWVQLATLDPGSNEIHYFNRGHFELHEPPRSKLPAAASSTDWYRGWRKHLGFAQISQ